MFDDNSPLYSFGYGLSYTTFAFEKPSVDHDQVAPNQIAHVSIKVTNTGQRAGDEAAPSSTRGRTLCWLELWQARN